MGGAGCGDGRSPRPLPPRLCLMHGIDRSGSSFPDTPSLRACLGVVSAAPGSSPADRAQCPDPARAGERGEAQTPSPRAVLGTVPGKGRSPVSLASGPAELVLLRKQPGPVVLLVGSSSSQIAVRPWVGHAPSLNLTHRLYNGNGVLVSIDRMASPQQARPWPAACTASPRGRGPGIPSQTPDGPTSPCLGPATHLKHLCTHVELKKEMAEGARVGGVFRMGCR